VQPQASLAAPRSAAPSSLLQVHAQCLGPAVQPICTCNNCLCSCASTHLPQRLHVLSLSSVTTCVLQQHIAITIVELKKACQQPAAGACGHYVTDYAWSSTWPFALAAGRLRSEKRTGSFTALMSALTSVVSGGVDAVADATVSNLPVHSLDTGVDVEHLDICHLGHHK